MDREDILNYPTKTCTMCGKTFDLWDHQLDFSMDRDIGYGSAHDLEHIKLQLCCACFDKVMDWILPQCVQDPVTESTEGI